MRIIKFIPNEYYHIYNRGNNKQTIFLENRDWARFLFLILYLQSPVNFPQIGRFISNYFKYQDFKIRREQNKIKEIIKNRYVELIAFALMPNHFHIAVKENQEKGLSRYMQKIQNAYTKYFNVKYEKFGHLFQGPFRAVHIKSNEQLLYLSTYIHRNPKEMSQWANREHLYPWSSYQDYISKNRWEEILKTDLIINQFNNSKEYKNFVDTSVAKLNLGKEILLD